MASYLPPTELLPIFENSVFDSNNTTALTYSEAKKYFVSYPIAQGASTISDFIAGAISYLTPASGSFFNIGINQISGGTIRIGPTGVSGVSVHAGNIDCTNNTINNATDAALNNLSIGNLQTSGILNIGTGARVLTGNGGAINIGTGAGAIANPINIGGAGTVTTFTNGLTLASDKYITTSHSTSISGPTLQTQIGYVITPSNGGLTSTTVPNSGTVSTIQSITLSTGVWIVIATRNINNSGSCTRVNFSFGDTSRTNGGGGNSGDFKWGISTLVPNGQLNYMTLTGIVSALVPTTVYFNLFLEYTSAPSITSVANINFNAVRIA